MEEEIELSPEAIAFIAGWLSGRRITAEPTDEEMEECLIDYAAWSNGEDGLTTAPN